MQRFPKVFTLMSAILALAFCLASCKTNVDDYPTMYTVTVSSSIEHGKVSVDKTSAEAGATVKLTATADSGYELESYSVKDASENELTVTDGTFTMPESNVTVSATFKATAVTPQKTAGSISYATTTVSKTTAAEAFTNTLKNTGDGTVTYASSKTAVAEVNTQNGLVTIKGAGETTITATVADSDTYTYAVKTASYTLTVTQASPLNLNLKTGADINSILVQLCKGSGDYPACTKFARSATNNEKATQYLDTEGKYIPVWSDGTEVYYYVPDGCTPVMNEDSSKMFDNCYELTSLDVSKFDTSKVTNMSGMFAYCCGLASLDVTGFDTSKVENMSGMFSYCYGLACLDVTGFDTSNVKNMKSMFSGCEGLTSLDLSKFDTSIVTDMKNMFSGCKELTTIYATDKFVTTSVTDGGLYCFDQCSKLVGGAGTIFDASDNGKTLAVPYARIDGGNSAPGYFTLKLIGSKSKPDAVGDIVFSDGSATPYSEDLTLTEDQKAAAIAVIYYAGSAEDVLGAKTLGVGLKNTGADNYLAWCLNSAAAYGTNITAIQCTPSPHGQGAAATATFTGDLDGSDNWQALCNAVNDEDTSGNYPAWEWVNAYATTTANLTGNYASGWYLPTVAELSMLYRVKDTVNSALEKAGGTEIADDRYWSSSQYASDYGAAWDVLFEYGKLDYNDLTNFRSVCPVRAF